MRGFGDFITHTPIHHAIPFFQGLFNRFMGAVFVFIRIVESKLVFSAPPINVHFFHFFLCIFIPFYILWNDTVPAQNRISWKCAVLRDFLTFWHWHRSLGNTNQTFPRSLPPAFGGGGSGSGLFITVLHQDFFDMLFPVNHIPYPWICHFIQWMAVCQKAALPLTIYLFRGRTAG